MMQPDTDVYPMGDADKEVKGRDLLDDEIMIEDGR